MLADLLAAGLDALADAFQPLADAVFGEAGLDAQAAEELFGPGNGRPDALVRQRFTSWVALRNGTLPVVGELPGQSGIYVINGLGPFGLSLALVAADELAELVLYKRTPTLFALEQS